MKKIILLSLFTIISSLISFSTAQTTNDTNVDIKFPIPDSITEALYQPVDTEYPTNDIIVIKSKLQSQKLLKNLFLSGFIFMTIIVIFLFYINNVKIKQIIKLVKQQEQQVKAKNFEIDKLSVILNNTMDGIAIIDKESKILWITQLLHY